MTPIDITRPKRPDDLVRWLVRAGLTSTLVFLFASDACFAYPVQGVGSVSCAQFAKFYQRDPESADSVFYAWAQGFMSGLNLAASTMQKPTRDLAGLAADQQRALRTYCANNPLKNYMDGVIEFYGQLSFSK